MAIAVTSVDRIQIASNGGRRLVLTGTFPLDTALRVYVGPTGTTADAQCWSGIPGQGHDVYAISATTLWCYSPILPVGDPMAILVRDPISGDSGALAAAVAVLPPDYRAGIYSLRSMFPPTHVTGPRRIENESPVPDWD